MLEIRCNIFLVVHILSVQLYNIQVQWPDDWGWGSWSKCSFSPSSLTIGAVLYHIVRNKPNLILLQCSNVTPFPCYFFSRKSCKLFAT